jgi:glycosyltransferase involved in cell wall biosynthesis
VRIALVSEHADPLAPLGGVDAGGQNVHVDALATGLVTLGHDVVVYTRRAALGAATRERARHGYLVDRVTAGPPTTVPKDELLPHMDDFGKALRARLRRDPADLVHAHFWMSGLAALHATRGTGVPVLQTFHALGSVKRREQGDDDTSPASRIDCERRVCREVAHVVATCTDEVAELAALGLPEQRASVVPCGVDVETFSPGPPDHADRGVQPRRERHRVLALGRLVARKGVDDAVRALAALPDTELVVAGGPDPDAVHLDPESRRLEALARSLGVGERVRFVGGVARDEVPGWIRSSDLVVAAPWYEPFGIVPLEAMACGVPVVGTAVGGLLDTVVPGETGELVEPRRPDELAAAIGALLADPSRRASYGVAGRRRAVERYDWQRVVERTDLIYGAVVGALDPVEALG